MRDLTFCILLFNSVSYVFLFFRLCILIVMYALLCIFCCRRANWHSSATLTEFLSCFFLSCKANVRVKLAKTVHGPHSSKLANCVVLYIICVDCVLCIVCVYMCTVLLLPAGYPNAVNKCIISYHISYHIISYHIISYHIISYIIRMVVARVEGTGTFLAGYCNGQHTK